MTRAMRAAKLARNDVNGSIWLPRLRQLASEEGASLETVVERLLDDISDELNGNNNQLSEEQLADLRERIKNPGPIASPERLAAALAKFSV